MKYYEKGDYNQDFCEIWYDGEFIGDVRTRDAERFVRLLNKKNNEIMFLRGKLVKIKLIFSLVVEDLDKQAETEKPIVINKKYTDWIKSEVDLKFSNPEESD